jgi:uncharacterized repeat protein (TIGR01451 family)
LIICYGKKLVGKVDSRLKAWRGLLLCKRNKHIPVSDLPGYFTGLIAKTLILLFLMTVALWLACSGVSYAAIIINAPMTDTNASGWTLGGNPTSSLLTGDGAIDPVGSGWLRLTNNSGNQTGFAYNTTTFDLSQGLLIQFDYATWGGNGADGYSVYLFDAGVSPFNIGAFGGSLGYAQKLSTATCNPVTPSVAGISGGYVGIGVDEFGNFAYGCEGRYLGASQQANTVTIRGSVVGFGGGAIGSTLSATSYPWIVTSANNGSLWYNGTTRPDQTSTNYRRVTIQISPAPNPVANVWVQFGYNTSPVQMITNQALPAISTSQLLMMGYAASTGGSTNYHEIRNLLVTNANESTTIDLGIAKTVVDTSNNPVTSVAPGGAIRYLVTATNYGPNNVTATGVGIVDNIPATITGVTWTCAAMGGATCGVASGSGNTLNTTANLPRYGAVTYTINGTVSAPANSTISNTASLVIPGAVSDFRSDDDSATANVTVSVAGTGNKPLYLIYDTGTTGHLYRTPSAVTANYVSIANGSTVSWALSPVLQSADTISSGSIPVQLWLSASASKTYTINPIALLCGATTVATLTTGTAALTGTAATFTFNLPHATSYTCTAGNAWTLNITNSTATGTVRVWPAPSANNYSKVTLPSQNVINVDSEGFYSASYASGGGTAITVAAPGQIVYIRSTISDPFGSYDISAANVTITDSASTVRVNAGAMTMVYDTGYAKKIYEYAYTVPVGGPTGTWTAKVVASEGSEGTVTHSLTETLTVAVPNLLVVKSADKASVVPGDIITYTEIFTNTDPAGKATSVVVTDSWSPHVQWGLNSYGAGVAFQFVNGTPASGLTLGIPIYSNNNGTTWVYTPVSGGGGAPAGYDGNVTNWQIPMSGTMNANGANFTINYKVRVK